MRVYLEDIPLEEARSRLETALAEAGLQVVLGKETIPLDQGAVGRVLADPIWAEISSPHYHASAMDGFAVRAESTYGALETAPVTLSFGKESVYLDTGDPVPLWADAVIPIEHVEPLDDQGRAAADPRKPAAIRIRGAAKPWMNIRPMGEDMVATELVLPAGHQLRPVDLGAAAGCGHDRLIVSRKPSVAILPTGSELVNPGDPVQEGEIIEYNSIVLAAQMQSWGAEATRFDNLPDDPDVLQQAVQQAAADHDLILVIAGSSAGSEDYTARIVEESGDLLVHGVAVRPGHPVIMGMIQGAGKTPLIGVPGYPVSAALTAEIFVEPLLAGWLGRRPETPQRMQAALTRKITSPAGDDDYVRVAVGYVEDRPLAAPLSRGSGVITSLVRADGLVVIPRGSQGLPAGAEVSVRLIRPREEIRRTIFAIGSHDITLDILAQYLAREDRRLTSANVGSLAGIMALKRRETHLAGAHLLDPQTGEYNLPFLENHLPGRALRVITLVGRTQGLIVPRGNPRRIRTLEDLAGGELRFVNRQPGAGTRLLLDYRLGKLGLDPGEIQGYGHEEYTHLTAAAAVASGRADCTLGIEAAARALELDFIPLDTERYDLIIPRQYLEDDLLTPLLALLEDQAFRQAVASRPGYDISQMGKVVADLP
jgi:putative molybdopterin biosynthesis protein